MDVMNRIYRKIKQGKRTLLSWYAKHFMKAPNVLSIDTTLALVINERYSLCRNGDGELDLMLGESIDFQRKDSRLARLMREALNANMDKYLSCLPNVFGDNSRFNDYAAGYFDRYLRTKRYCYYTLAQAHQYGDSFVSRFYMDLKDKSNAAKQVERVKQIWAGQDVVLLEGKESRLGVNNDLFDGAKSMSRILGPAENAFDRYDELKEKVMETATTGSLVLLALGPTATAMAYELAKAGYWAVDIGHIDIEYEWFLMGAVSKVAVPGKYTNECDAGKLSGTLPQEALKKYHSEIVAKIF